MKLSIVHIINNKLHNFEYLNYTIIFYIIVLYTYYSLFVYLLNKNYIILLLYFTFFILVYNSYKNFTYIIGLVILIIFKIFNIDTRLNNNSINSTLTVLNNSISVAKDNFSQLTTIINRFYCKKTTFYFSTTTPFNYNGTIYYTYNIQLNK